MVSQAEQLCSLSEHLFSSDRQAFCSPPFCGKPSRGWIRKGWPRAGELELGRGLHAASCIGMTLEPCTSLCRNLAGQLSLGGAGQRCHEREGASKTLHRALFKTSLHQGQVIAKPPNPEAKAPSTTPATPIPDIFLEAQRTETVSDGSGVRRPASSEASRLRGQVVAAWWQSAPRDAHGISRRSLAQCKSYPLPLCESRMLEQTLSWFAFGIWGLSKMRRVDIHSIIR